VRFKSPVWFPIAVLFSLGNVVAVWFAAVPAEPLHATIHAVLGAGGAAVAHRLLVRRGEAARRVVKETSDALDALEAAEEEANQLRRELGEAQDRLAFAERMLAREPEQQHRGGA
jgi:hypothetical protein